MDTTIGLLIIAAGALCQSSSYTPINRIRGWKWETYWLVQGVFAWIIFPFFGALMAVPAGESLFNLYAAFPKESAMTVVSGILWGIGGLTFGLSMRYLGIALGQSLSLGTCAAMGTILTPLLLGRPGELTSAVVSGVIVTISGIALIGYAGHLKSRVISADGGTSAIKEFNFPKGISAALMAGLMSACFNIGLGTGQEICFGDRSDPLLSSLPATFLVTAGGFLTNAVYCISRNFRNRSFSDYKDGKLWAGNVLYCILAGLLWYSQFFGLSLGKGFLSGSPVLLTFSWCILMALNVTFSNLWGIILKEWKGSSPKVTAVLISGLIILVLSSFLPQLIDKALTDIFHN